jgi:hypothetical protein
LKREKTGESAAYLEKSVLLLRLELVGPEKLQTTLSLLAGETVMVALEELEDIIDDNGLKVDLFFVVQVVGGQLDLHRVRYRGNNVQISTYRVHVDLSI